MIFKEKDKRNLLDSMDDLHSMFPAIRNEDIEYAACLLGKMGQMVDDYGPELGVKPTLERYTPNQIRRAFGLREFPDGSVFTKDMIKNVIINDRATIILWSDGSKTVVKCQEEDLNRISPEAGVAIAIMKKVFGNKGNFNNVLKDLVYQGLKEGYNQ